MIIDLSTILNGRTKKLPVHYEFEGKSSEEFALLPNNITPIKPIVVDGEIVDKNGYLALNCHVVLEYKTTCDRCLDDINCTLNIDFSRMIVTKKGAAISEIADEDDLIYAKQGFVEFDKEIYEQLSVEAPIYHLCQEGCLGLCPKCGKKIADGNCTCENKKEIDPRMAIFKKLLD